MCQHTKLVCFSFLSFLFMCMCMGFHVCICLFFCVWVHTHGPGCGGLVLISGIFLRCCSTLFTEAGSLSLTQSSPVELVSLASSLWNPYLFLPKLELQVAFHTHLTLIMSCEDLNSGPLMHATSPVAAEPSPHPLSSLMRKRCRETHTKFYLPSLHIFLIFGGRQIVGTGGSENHVVIHVVN